MAQHSKTIVLRLRLFIARDTKSEHVSQRDSIWDQHFCLIVGRAGWEVGSRSDKGSATRACHGWREKCLKGLSSKRDVPAVS
jgi:hypothetical protein